MTKKRMGIIGIILALVLCLSLSVIGAEYAKITGIEGSSEAEAANPPENIIDGDEVSRWGSMSANDYADFTFEKDETIESIDIMFFKAPERVHVIQVESSADGKTWTEVSMAKTSGVMDGTLQPDDRSDYANEGGYWDNFALTAPVTAKYWRINFLGREESGSLDTGSPMSVWEVRFILGAAAAAPVEEPAAPAEPELVAAEDSAPAADEPAAVETPAAPAAVTSAPKTGDAATALIIVICNAAALAFVVISRRKVNSK